MLLRMNQQNNTHSYDTIKELAGQERFFSKDEVKRLDRAGLSVAFFQSFWNSYIWAFVIGSQSDIDLLTAQLNADRTSVAAWPFRFKEHEEFLSKIGYFVWLADSPVPLDYNTRIRIQKKTTASGFSTATRFALNQSPRRSRRLG